MLVPSFGPTMNVIAYSPFQDGGSADAVWGSDRAIATEAAHKPTRLLRPSAAIVSPLGPRHLHTVTPVMERQAGWIVGYETACQATARMLSPNLLYANLCRSPGSPQRPGCRAGTCRIDKLSGNIGASRDPVNGAINDLGNVIRRPQQHQEDRRGGGAYRYTHGHSERPRVCG